MVGLCSKSVSAVGFLEKLSFWENVPWTHVLGFVITKQIKIKLERKKSVLLFQDLRKTKLFRK